MRWFRAKRLQTVLRRVRPVSAERSSRRPGLGFAAKVVPAIGLSIAAVAAILVWWNPAERNPSAPATESIVTVSPGEMTDDDALPAVLAIVWERGSQQYISNGTGTVTSVDVSQGAVPSTGTPLATVDGAIVFALASPRPLYRDLARGAEGQDVLAVEDLLAVLGILEPIGRTKVDRAMSDAIRTFNQWTGRPNDAAIFSAASVVWLGVAPQPIGSVLLRPGDKLSEQTAVFEYEPQVKTAKVAFAPGEAPTRKEPRVATTMDSNLVLHLLLPDHEVRPDQLALIEELGPPPDFQSSTNSAEMKVDVLSRLETPLQFQVLPVGAVVTSRRGDTCVYSDAGLPTPVELAGTEPGIVLIDKAIPLPSKIQVFSSSTSQMLTRRGQLNCETG